MRYLFLLLFLVACDSWQKEHDARCAAWLQRARNASDSLNVEMNCASIAAAHKAEQMSALNLGVTLTK